MTKQEANKLKPKAQDFIKACNAMPLVYANEGGIMHLDEILVDFVKYLSELPDVIDGGPNVGQMFPTPKSVQNFDYNGFMVTLKNGFASFEVVDFIQWTNDPGIGKFHCSDGKDRLIPSCQLSNEYRKSLPSRVVTSEDLLFGPPSSSK